MPDRKSFYRLSLEADQDIDDIFDYSESEFGFNKAVEYVEAFDTLFRKLMLKQMISRKRDEIKKGLRSIPMEDHVVFYQVLDNHIRIIHVLHGRRDLASFF